MTLFSRGRLTKFYCLIGLISTCLFSNVLMAAAALPNFADLVEQNAPSIVEISTIQIQEPRVFRGEDIDELLRQGKPIPDNGEQQLPQARERGAVGSGFIVSNDGYIITNHHVVAQATEIRVTLNDRRVFTAEVIGMDEPSDIALLKIQGEALPFVKFGDSDQLRVGDWVLAIGSPFGLEFSASAGIVSAKGRSMPGRSTYNYMAFIQTDVAINQGNSGGPLFNLQGDVVGINSQILSSAGGSNGISFSIPSNVADNVIEQLKATGVVARGLLGVRIRQVDHALAQIFELDRPTGAFIDDVISGSPAEQAGIANEDIVLEFNGRPILYSTDLPFYVGQYKPDTRADIVVWREGERHNLSVVLGSSPTNVEPKITPQVAPLSRNPLGFRVSSLGAENQSSGVRISELNPGPGMKAGLLVGDFIVSLNRQEINSTDDFANIASSLPRDGFVPIRIRREGQGGTTKTLDMSE